MDPQPIICKVEKWHCEEDSTWAAELIEEELREWAEAKFAEARGRNEIKRKKEIIRVGRIYVAYFPMFFQYAALRSSMEDT